MYIRFVVSEKDEDSGRKKGIFHVARYLCEDGLVSIAEERKILSIRNWFNEHLNKPKSFARSRKPHAKNVAISWFRSSAKKHIAKMYELTRILESHGVAVEVLKTSRPGYVVYEDEFQVTAEPFIETGA